MKKRLTLLLALGLVAALTPALAESGSYDDNASEDIMAQTETAPAAAVEASEACAAEAAEPGASQVATALTTPAGPIFTTVLDLPTSSIQITCNLCDTHADCSSVCSGQPAVNFVCSRHFNSCYGWGPKVCICF